jgi:hypothetical protein
VDVKSAGAVLRQAHALVKDAHDRNVIRALAVDDDVRSNQNPVALSVKV